MLQPSTLQSECKRYVPQCQQTRDALAGCIYRNKKSVKTLAVNYIKDKF